jgi:hypothetical protein
MLWSQFSAIFANFRRKNWCRRKLAFFFKNDAMVFF